MSLRRAVEKVERTGVIGLGRPEEVDLLRGGLIDYMEPGGNDEPWYEWSGRPAPAPEMVERFRVLNAAPM